jgi:UDP-N-acetylmuramate dehydrogenase
LRIQENIRLAPLTTFQVGGPARYFVDAQSEAEVEAAVAYAAAGRWPLFVLGGGSNLVISDSGWPGLVVKIGVMGVESKTEGAAKIYAAGAGESWDALVAHTVGENSAGLECLSGIPGTVGGTPVQNVGAYGQEVSEVITRVRVLEIASGRIREMDNASCGFRYRSSIFNGSRRGEYIVLEVEYRLRPGGAPTLEYADLKKHFSAPSRQAPALAEVRDAVRAIRGSKAMLLVGGDEDSRSAGSFFKNPVLGLAEADRVQHLAESVAPGKALPRYPAADGLVKLSAAWLVEQAGFHKGYNRGRVGISRKHSLAIVNRGGAKAADIVALKNEVQGRVREVWGVELEPEPVFVGFEKT